MSSRWQIHTWRWVVGLVYDGVIGILPPTLSLGTWNEAMCQGSRRKFGFTKLHLMPHIKQIGWTVTWNQAMWYNFVPHFQRVLLLDTIGVSITLSIGTEAILHQWIVVNAPICTVGLKRFHTERKPKTNKDQLSI